MLCRSPTDGGIVMSVKELFVEAMRRTDAGDIDGFIAMQAPDCAWITPNGELHGHDELRAWLSPWLSGFPTERRHELTRVDERDGTIYAEGVFHGVNAGPMETPEGTLPPTGRTVAMPFAIFGEADAEAGVAHRIRIYYDQLGFLGQLGLLPEPAATA
jgi:hypothetical protein